MGWYPLPARFLLQKRNMRDVFLPRTGFTFLPIVVEELRRGTYKRALQATPQKLRPGEVESGRRNQPSYARKICKI